MYRLVEEMLKLEEQEDDRFDPKKNLRSKIIEMFYKEGFSMVAEQRAATGSHFEFKKEDIIIKVFIPD